MNSPEHYDSKSPGRTCPGSFPGEYRVVFCADQRMQGPLQVAARQVLIHFEGRPSFWVLGETEGGAELESLKKSLDTVAKDYRLTWRQVSPAECAGFPRLRGSVAAYLRLWAPDCFTDGRCLYLDCDTLCQTDLAPLFKEDLGSGVVGMCGEAPLQKCVDPQVARELGGGATGDYFNSGVILFDVTAWRQGRFTEKCLDYVRQKRPVFQDQSAINRILHRKIHPLPGKYNLATNVRKNWPQFRPPACGRGGLLHFIDYPKPWSLGGRWIHPFGAMWWREYRQTDHFKRVGKLFGRLKFNKTCVRGYRKTLKDKLLFQMYKLNWIVPKGVRVMI